MATVDIIAASGGSPDDGSLSKTGTSFALCNASTPTVVTNAQSKAMIRQYTSTTPAYNMIRMFICFDVSAYAGATISAAHMHFFVGGTRYGDSYATTIYYHDWGTSLAAGDWTSDLGGLTAASASFSPNTSWGQIEVTLTNVSNILTANGRFEMTLDLEQTELLATAVHGWDVCLSDNTTEARRPILHLDYEAAATGKPINLFRQRTSIPPLGGLNYG